MRYLTGIQIATTDTTGGAPISGQLDWGTPETFDSLAYRVEWDGDILLGAMVLETIISIDEDVSLIYRDTVNGVSLVAVSADGPVDFDAAEFVEPGYGGFEEWSLVDAALEPNRYATITRIYVPEPALAWFALAGFGWWHLLWRRSNEAAQRALDGRRNAPARR